jgi:monovalent cation:H+ antiporter-2, CPA2 family
MEAAALDISLYKQALIVLSAAGVVIPLFHRLRLSQALGFILVGMRWTRLVGQFGGLVKLGSGCCQAASLSVSLTPYASSGVRPARVE